MVAFFSFFFILLCIRIFDKFSSSFYHYDYYMPPSYTCVSSFYHCDYHDALGFPIRVFFILLLKLVYSFMECVFFYSQLYLRFKKMALNGFVKNSYYSNYSLRAIQVFHIVFRLEVEVILKL